MVSSQLCLDESSHQETIEKLWKHGALIIPTGGPTGKIPLLKFSNKRHPLQLVFSHMKKSNSFTYGIRLPNITVIDIDDHSSVLLSEVIDQLGDTPFKVSTGRGMHLYYSSNQNPNLNFRERSMPIDVKHGINSYVIGPNSLRPDGVFYKFEGEDISLLNLPKLRNREKDRVLYKKGNVVEGNRNSFLVKRAINYVEFVDSEDQLFGNLVFDRDEYCDDAHTISNSEVLKIAKWAWNKRLSNQIYGNKNSSIRIDRQAFHIIYHHENGRAAWELYFFLCDKHAHIAGKTFKINVKSILSRYHFHFGQKAMHRAINLLLELGYLKLAKNYSSGKSSRTFQLSKPNCSSVIRLG